MPSKGLLEYLVILLRKQTGVKQRVKNETLGSPTFLSKWRKKKPVGARGQEMWWQDTANVY